jgi:hypothetical protein
VRAPDDPGNTDLIRSFVGNRRRECHRGDTPALGKMMLAGFMLDLIKVKVPVYRLSATEELVRPHPVCGQSAGQGVTTEPNGQ